MATFLAVPSMQALANPTMTNSPVKGAKGQTQICYARPPACKSAPLGVQVRADGGETELTKYTHEGVQHEVGGLLAPVLIIHCTIQRMLVKAQGALQRSSCRRLLLAAAHCYMACVSTKGSGAVFSRLRCCHLHMLAACAVRNVEPV